ncbi:MAG: hypothetical protein LBI74_07950 [Synergistaceae bacterium]|jgi:Holliday junction resolvase RusA-like endonuclease|nr:hypothetical protein [Synergistaceae bacterium]
MKTAEIILQCIDLYEEYLSSEYAMYLILRDEKDVNLHHLFLYGNIDKARTAQELIRKNDENHTNDRKVKIHTSGNGAVNILESTQKARIVLVSKELLYDCVLSIDEKITIKIDLFSTMYGKSRCSDYYVIKQIRIGDDDVFLINTRFDINNYQGTLWDCVREIFYTENGKEHPYSEYNLNYEDAYANWMKRSLEEVIIDTYNQWCVFI